MRGRSSGVEAGVAAARDGEVRDADEVFASIAAKRGWSRQVHVVFAEPAARDLEDTID